MNEEVYFTHREKLVIALIGERGLTNKAIAAFLGISLRTAETFIAHVKEKIKMHSSRSFTRWCVLNYSGLLDKKDAKRIKDGSSYYSNNHQEA